MQYQLTALMAKIRSPPPLEQLSPCMTVAWIGNPLADAAYVISLNFALHVTNYSDTSRAYRDRNVVETDNSKIVAF